jgi:hypothetical protein
MFEAKHRAGVPRDLLEASDAAFSHVPAILKAGQAAGEIVEGDPARLSLTLSAALQGLVTISTDGKFKGVPLEARDTRTGDGEAHPARPAPAFEPYLGVPLERTSVGLPVLRPSRSP